MDYAQIEANARLLADKITETQPHHIFIGDGDHRHTLTTLSCISHPYVMEVLQETGKNPICIEAAGAVVEHFEDFLKQEKPFEGCTTHQEQYELVQRAVAADPEYVPGSEAIQAPPRLLFEAASRHKIKGLS